MLPEDRLIEEFEDLTLDPHAFQHADHVRLGFAYLCRFDLVATMARYRAGLRAFTTLHGQPDKYHETVTCGLLVLIHERMSRREEGWTWEEFARENRDLLRFRDGIFFEYYPPEVLTSELARRTFVLPHPPPRRGEGSASPVHSPPGAGSEKGPRSTWT